MANGYCPAILLHMSNLAGCDPYKKLGPKGFLSGVLSQMDDSITADVNSSYTNGHTRPVTVAYRKRPLSSTTLTTLPDCETAATSAIAEFSLPSLISRSRSVWIPMSLIRQYCADVSNFVKLGPGSETRVMREVYDVLIGEAGALIGSINTALVTAMSTQFGVNTVTGVNTSTALSFGLGTNGMSDAFTRLVTDVRENEICNDGKLFIAGNGPFANLDLIRNWFANGPADNGIDKANMMQSFPNVFFDKDTRAVWGANQIGVFETGSLALINAPQYVGNFAGKFGGSEYSNIAFPVEEYCCPQQYLDRLRIDVQVKEFDCNPTLTLDGGAAAAAGGPGVMVMLSWQGNLFVRPTTLYNTGDPLEGTNGTLRYTITATS